MSKSLFRKTATAVAVIATLACGSAIATDISSPTFTIKGNEDWTAKESVTINTSDTVYYGIYGYSADITVKDFTINSQSGGINLQAQSGAPTTNLTINADNVTVSSKKYSAFYNGDANFGSTLTLNVANKLDVDAPQLTVTGDNKNLIVNAGTVDADLTTSKSAAIVSYGSVEISADSIDIVSSNYALWTSSYSANGSITLNAKNGDLNLAGAILQYSPGKTTLQGKNVTVNGSVWLTNGSLSVSGDTTTIDGDVSVVKEATLALNSPTTTINGSLDLTNGATINLVEGTNVTINSEDKTIVGNGVITGNASLTLKSAKTALYTGTRSITANSVTIESEGVAISGYGSNEISAKTITIKGEDAINIPDDVSGRGGKYLKLKDFDTLLISGKDYGIVNNAYTTNQPFELTIEGNEGSTVTIENTFEGDTKAAVQNVSYKVSSVEDQANENFQAHTFIKAGSIIINSPNYAVINRSGDVSFLGTESVTVNGNVKTSEGTNLNVTGQNTTFNGTVEALGTVKLDNTVASFNEDATIGTLAGAGTTILFNEKLANLTVNQNNATGLTFAATAAANEAVGGDASKLIGNQIAWNDSINTSMVLAEGEVVGEVVAELSKKDGKLFVKSQTESRNVTNSSMLDVTQTTNIVTRTEMNDLRKRMGDLRASEGKYGTWARYDGGQFSGSNSFEHDFSKLQFGADAAVTANTRVGLAFSYTKGDSDYAQGSADTDTYSLAAYGIWLGEKGQYADVIARFANHKTEFNNKNTNAKLDNVSVSLSGEFGWRLSLNEKTYVEPAVEMTYTNVDSDSFKGRLGTQYNLDSTDSLMAKAGVTAGLQCPNNKGDVYVRVAAVHEFLNDAKLTATGVNGTSRSLRVDGKDTWIEYAIGGQYNVNKSTYIYADVERTSGASLEEDWRANVGLRYNF